MLVVVVLLAMLVVVVLLVVVGDPHTPATHTLLQQLWFVLQDAPSGLQGWVALPGVARRSALPTARDRSSVGVIRFGRLAGCDMAAPFSERAALPEGHWREVVWPGGSPP